MSGEQFAPIDKPYMKLYQERMSDPRQTSNQPRGEKKRGKVVSQHHTPRKTRKRGGK